MKRILVIAAHPDDEVLGCGGTIARLVEEGDLVYTLILGEGVTSRDNKRNTNKMLDEIIDLRKSAIKANKILGVKGVSFKDFPDNKFDTIPLLDIVKAIEETKSKIKPDIIFTHYEKDLNIDHQITYNATITATRPLREETVKEVYSFEVPSSTEWAYPTSFSPDVFYNISKTINIKLIALSSYEKELRGPLHPRSLTRVWDNANLWGIKVGLDYAEAFKIVRSIK
ncbi:putative N-acetyl-alpha-D-glucosaminyl L-malate deacetylase 2 [subsurface metagenome]